jgi:hypothetical protein
MSTKNSLIFHWLIFIFTHFSETKDLACEELVIDSIVTINNISFYNSDLILNYSQKIIDCICYIVISCNLYRFYMSTFFEGLIKYLLSTNSDAVLEVFRVLANLCRDQSVRNYLVLRKSKCAL